MTDPGHAAHRGPRYGWLVGLALVLAAGIGGLALAGQLRGPSPAGDGDRPHEPAELDTSEYLRPLETAADPRTGERTAPFTGFAVSVETDPPAALVAVAGEERGESPVLAGVACKPGEKVQVRVAKAGFRPARETITCRKDALVKLEVRLTRP